MIINIQTGNIDVTQNINILAQFDVGLDYQLQHNCSPDLHLIRFLI